MPITVDDTHDERSAAPAGASEAFDVESKLGGSKGLRVEAPRAAFVLVFNPDSWIQVGDEVLPLLSEHALTPGVNNVRAYFDKATGRTTYDLDLFDVALAKKGARRIPSSACTAEDTPDRLPGYVRRRAVEGGWYHHTPWETLAAVGTRAVHRTDSDGYWRWVRNLIERGVIPRPDESIIARMADQAQSIADAASARHDDASKRLHAAKSAASATLRGMIDGSAEVADARA